ARHADSCCQRVLGRTFCDVQKPRPHPIWKANFPFLRFVMSEASAPIPVTVLTGYLGSGKTTLLNRILSENHGKRYAVIVNECGEIGIDNDLIVESDEEIYEMNNGCVCCTVQIGRA